MGSPGGRSDGNFLMSDFEGRQATEARIKVHKNTYFFFAGNGVRRFTGGFRPQGHLPRLISLWDFARLVYRQLSRPASPRGAPGDAPDGPFMMSDFEGRHAAEARTRVHNHTSRFFFGKRSSTFCRRFSAAGPPPTTVFQGDFVGFLYDPESEDYSGSFPGQHPRESPAGRPGLLLL
jgi:hypothetical protein